jgi:tetratricopeptide (TPR) repeat protein
MYKSRFKAWGLTKHLKTQEVEQICNEALHGKPLKLPLIRGRPIGSKKFKRYLDQVNMAAAGQAPPPLFHRAASPFPGRLQAPDSLQFSEECMHAASSIARRGIETKSFNFVGLDYEWQEDLAMTFWHNLNFASDQISEKNNLPEAFRLLHNCYDDFALVLDKQDPSMVWTALLSVLVLATVGYDLAASFVRYVAGLSAIKLGRHAPLTCLFNKIQAMGIAETRQAAFSIVTAHHNALQSDNRVGEEFRRVAHLHAIRSLNRRGALSFTSTVAAYKKTLKDFAACQDTKNSVDWYYWALLLYSNLLCDNGKFAEAMDGLEPISKHLRGDSGEFDYDALEDPLTMMSYYSLKGRVLEALGQIDEATPYFVGNYELTTKVSQHNVLRLTAAVSALEAHYRRKNDIEAADKFRADFEANWARLLDVKITWHMELPPCTCHTESGRRVRSKHCQRHIKKKLFLKA